MTDHPGWIPPHPSAPAPPPASKGIGIAAMVLGIVGLVLAFIPFVGLIGLALGLLAVVLGIVAVVQRTGRGQGIAGIVTGAASVVVAGTITLLLGIFASAVDDERRSRGEVDVVESPSPAEEDGSGPAQAPDGSAEASSGEAAESAESDAEPRDETADEASEEASEDDSGSDEAGSRENPLTLGETAVVDDWEVTIHDVTFDADEQIAAESPVNDSAPEGSSYALIDAEITYTGDGSSTSLLDVGIAYVADSGETHSWTDQFVLTPDELDRSQELYSGGTARGNVAIAVPEDGEGLVRARVGLFSTTDVFFEAG